MAIFNHLKRWNFGYIDPNKTSLDRCNLHHGVDNSGKKQLFFVIGTARTYMAVNKYLLRTKRASANEMISPGHIGEDHLCKEALSASRFAV
ncbi:hypothetical protein ASG35_08305 [Burkholderia sp. Leaf177]|nr:hypothetical protein ASG35_08305 [Burkholderia sp. Leaf177]